MNTHALSTAATRTGVWRLLVETLQTWGWTHTALALFMGAFSLFNMGGALSWGADFPWGRSYAYNAIQFGLPIVLTVRMADRARDEGAHAGWAYGLAAGLTVFLGVWVFGPALYPLLGGETGWSFANDLGLFMNVLLPYALAVMGYAYWRDTKQQRERMHASAMDRAQRQRAVQGARLLALQSRVEPELLAAAITRVQQLIDLSAEAAEAELERLIALLRAMQPQVRAQTSHVAREIELIQRYANVARIEALSLPRWHMSASEDARFAKLAPMVMLPLAKALAASSSDGMWLVKAEVLGSMLLVRFQASADAAPSASLQAAIAQANTRLRDVHGEQSSVQWLADQRGLVVTAPFEEDAQSRKAQTTEET